MPPLRPVDHPAIEWRLPECERNPIPRGNFMNLHLDANAADTAVSLDDMPDILLGTGLRPTRQRIALLKLLIATNRRYVTAEILYDEASKAHCHVSRATVCSALRQFEQAGLAKRTSISRSRKAWFALDRDCRTYS